MCANTITRDTTVHHEDYSTKLTGIHHYFSKNSYDDSLERMLNEYQKKLEEEFTKQKAIIFTTDGSLTSTVRNRTFDQNGIVMNVRVYRKAADKAIDFRCELSFEDQCWKVLAARAVSTGPYSWTSKHVEFTVPLDKSPSALEQFLRSIYDMLMEYFTDNEK